MPAQHADGARVVEVAVRERLELGREHVALLGAEAELGHALRDRLGVERRQRREREERIVRARQRRGAGSTKRFQALSAIAWRSAIGPLRRSPSTAHVTSSGSSLSADALAGARQLGPGVRLVPVHPAAAHLDVVSAPVAVPGAPAEPVARLDQRAVEPGDRQLARRRDSGEPASDDDRIEHGPSLAETPD